MICRSCNLSSNRIKVIAGADVCTHCGLVETGGSKVDNLITRNSFRVREQQKQMAGDMVTPWTYDKQRKKVVVNQEFIRNFPDQAKKTFSDSELKASNNAKLIETPKL